jgi:ribose transport system ATP-binding protein
VSGDAEATQVGPPLLVARGVAKSFGATAALRDGTFCVRAGEVHALMGENGAGKSTLLGVLAGLHRADAGVIELEGRPFAPRSAADARAAGIAIVPQEPALCDHLTVVENITLGVEPTRAGFVRAQEARAVAKRALAPLGVDVDLTRLGAALAPAERQVVCIARALAQSIVKVLILDEPTSSLTHAEADPVLEAVRTLAASGVCVLYVSHTLGEVVRVASTFTVLRNGETVKSGSMSGVGVSELTELLLGHSVEARARAERALGPTVLSAKDVAGARLPAGVSFELSKGEILGVFGLMGSGRTELVRALFGLDRALRGEVRIGGAPPTAATPARRLSERVGMLSEDRKSEGLALAMSVADNVTLSRLEPVSRFGFVSTAAQAAATQRLIEQLSIRCSGPEAPASSLSGGNQQKVALARLLHHDVDVLLLDEPTRGIDIGSRELIYDLAVELAARGKSILWISSQPAELLGVCDRVAVMRRGVLGAPRPARELDERALLAEAAS